MSIIDFSQKKWEDDHQIEWILSFNQMKEMVSWLLDSKNQSRWPYNEIFQIIEKRLPWIIRKLYRNGEWKLVESVKQMIFTKRIVEVFIKMEASNEPYFTWKAPVIPSLDLISGDINWLLLHHFGKDSQEFIIKYIPSDLVYELQCLTLAQYESRIAEYFADKELFSASFFRKPANLNI